MRLCPYLFILVPLLAAPAFAQAPSLEQILASHIDARGGLAKIKAIRTMTSTGRVEIGSMALALRIEHRRGAFRSDTSFQGMTKSEVFDGKAGWIIDPFTGSPKAEPMSPAQLRQAELQADYDGPLVDWRTKGHRIALAGKVSVNGVEAYVLNVAMKNGDTLISFIDARTFMEIKAINKAVSEGRMVEVETLLGDYRPVNGVMLPFSLDIRPKGQPQSLKIVLDKVEVNLPLDDARFNLPVAKATLMPL